MSRRIIIATLWVGMFALMASTIPSPPTTQKRTSTDIKIRKIGSKPDFKQ